LDTLLWIAQGILGALMIIIGIMECIQPEKLDKNAQWVKDYPGLVKFIGVSEVLGGIGLVVPWLTEILPILTPMAAIGIGIIMVLAAVFNFRRKDFRSVRINIFLLAISVFISYGRFLTFVK